MVGRAEGHLKSFQLKFTFLSDDSTLIYFKKKILQISVVLYFLCQAQGVNNKPRFPTAAFRPPSCLRPWPSSKASCPSVSRRKRRNVRAPGWGRTTSERAPATRGRVGVQGPSCLVFLAKTEGKANGKREGLEFFFQ